MAGNELSRKTEQALRKKLRAEREVLRNRVAVKEQVEPPKQEATSQPAPDAPPVKPSKIDKKDYTFNIEIVLNDRRPSDELQDYELRRRLGSLSPELPFDERYEESAATHIGAKSWSEMRPCCSGGSCGNGASAKPSSRTQSMKLSWMMNMIRTSSRTTSMPPKLMMRNWKMFSSLRHARK